MTRPCESIYSERASRKCPNKLQDQLQQALTVEKYHEEKSKAARILRRQTISLASTLQLPEPHGLRGCQWKDRVVAISHENECHRLM